MIEILKQLKNAIGRDKERHLYIENVWNVYSGSWEDSSLTTPTLRSGKPSKSLIMKELEKRFPVTWKKLARNADTSINLLRWASSKVGNIYDVPTTRLVNDEEVPQYDTAILQQTLSQLVPLSYALRNMFIRPMVVEGEILYDVIRPDQATVLPDPLNPRKLLAIAYKVGTRYVVWTKENHWVFGSQDFNNPILNPENPNNVNPYGIVPVVSVPNDFPIGSFWDTFGSNELYTSSIETAIALTDLRRLQQVASHKQPYLKGDPDKDFDRFAILDPANPIILRGKEATAGVLDLKADLQQGMSTILKIAGAVLSFMGFNPKIVTGESASPQSGFAILLQNADLEAVRDKLRTTWTLHEQSLYSVTRQVVEVERLHPENSSLESLPEGQITTLFGDTSNPLSPQEEKDYWHSRLQGGTTTLVDVLMELDGLSKESAEEKALEIEEYKNRSAVTSTFFPPPMEETEETIEEPEVNEEDI